MPCARGTATSQIKRLSGIPYFSKLPSEAIAELELALHQYADDAQHAQEAISALLHDGKRGSDIPTPNQILQYLAATKKTQPPKFEGCDQCQGTGFVDGPTVWRSFHGVRQPYSTVKDCSCRQAN